MFYRFDTSDSMDEMRKYSGFAGNMAPCMFQGIPPCMNKGMYNIPEGFYPYQGITPNCCCPHCNSGYPMMYNKGHRDNVSREYYQNQWPDYPPFLEEDEEVEEEEK